MIGRRAFDNIFWRKAHYLQFLASFQVSSILLTGQGKVGAENGRPSTPYQISQRADFFETLQGLQTTYNRPIVNARDEALCGLRGGGDPSAPARLHVIFFDSALAQSSCLFRVGPMQLILALLEQGLVNSRLILDDPLIALQSFSADPTLKTTAELIAGERFTALELQSAYLEEVKRHAARGVFEGVVPRAEEIIALWEDTLGKLAAGDLMAAAPRLDWVMKLLAIERTMDERPELDWDSAEVKVIDHLYSSLGGDGLYWAYQASGFAEQLVPPERIAHFTANPPADTRAWTRAMLLRRASNDNVDVESVDWDRITFKIRGRYAWPSYRTLDLANPLGFTQAEAQPIFDQCEDFGELLDALESHSAGEAPPLDAIAINPGKRRRSYALSSAVQ
jgi:proteasome accessory factor A